MKGNPFYVAPGGNFMQGLQGLARSVDNYGEDNRRRQAEERVNMIREEMTAAYQSGEPDQMRAVIAKYPMESRWLQDYIQWSHKESKAMMHGAWSAIYENPDKAEDILSATIGRGEAMGINMSQSKQDAQGLLGAMDPESVRKQAEMALLTSGGEIPDRDERTTEQKNFEYWQNLPEGSEVRRAFGEQRGFVESRKDELSVKKLEAELQALENPSLAPEKRAELEGKLRGEVHQRSKEYEQVDNAYRRIQASASDPSPAGDLALIFNYMKILDPGSTVREGEFGTAQNAGGVDAKVLSLYNSVINGKRLSPSQRKDFVARAEKLYAAANNKHKVLEVKYGRLAERYGVDPGNVVLRGSEQSASASQHEYKEGQKAQGPNGEIIVFHDGIWVPE